MTTNVPLPFASVGTHEIDLKTRQRVAAHLRMLRYRFRFESDAAMAERLDMSRGALNRYLKGERTAGLDVLLKVHRRLHVSLDYIVDEDPPSEWFDPGYVPKK
jgi:transcriptional regulator with XRE-family HTH domain